MKPIHKVALVVAGYVGAFGIAFAVTYLYTAMTWSPDRDLYSGMYAFGDALLFLATFTVVSVPTTCVAFHFLKPHRAFWKVLAASGTLNATAGIAAGMAFFYSREPGYLLSLAPLRLIAGAGFSLFFALACIFSPKGRLRAVLGAVAAVEAIATALFIAFVTASR